MSRFHFGGGFPFGGMEGGFDEESSMCHINYR
jgi:hypothetical protein